MASNPVTSALRGAFRITCVARSFYRHCFPRRALNGLFLLLLLASSGPAPAATPETVTIGVLAFRDPLDTLTHWQLTADYLNRNIPDAHFTIAVFGSLTDLTRAAEGGRIDFVLTNPSQYARLENDLGTSRVLTLERNTPAGPRTQFGAVIFTRAEHPGLRSLHDVAGHTLAAVDRNAFGGFQIAWDELRRHEIRPLSDAAKVTFMGLPQDRIVDAVLDGRVEVGIVRTGVLEAMAAFGRIDLDELRVLGARRDSEFGLLHSTDLYPEWPLAVLPHVEHELAEEVARALPALRSDSPAAKAAGLDGWTVPLDYSPIHRLLQRLQIEPYAEPHSTHWQQVLSEYRIWVIGALLVFAALGLAITTVARLNASLRRSRHTLEQMNADIAAAHNILAGILRSLPAHVAVIDSDGVITHVNDAWTHYAAENGGSQRTCMEGANYLDVCESAGTDREVAQRVAHGLRRILSGKETEFHIEYPCHSPGQRHWFLMSAACLAQGARGAVISHTEITRRVEMEHALRAERDEQTKLLAKIKQTQDQLLQTEKMASIGQLAAGVAHEINNPVGYVYSNLGTLENYVRDLLELISTYEAFEDSCSPPDALLSTLLQQKQELQLDYLRDDAPALVAECQEGLTRVKNIVQDLKDFSHVREAEWEWTDLEKGLESTLNIVHNELKYKATVEKHYDKLPLVRCVPSQINQVLMNLLVNAAQAIEDSGRITVATGTDGHDWVWIDISDTGSGIDAKDIDHLFDPFFTTKPVGQGTGLGLALSYSIVERHGGDIQVSSQLGEGSRFRVRLPVFGAETATAPAPERVEEMA